MSVTTTPSSFFPFPLSPPLTSIGIVLCNLGHLQQPHRLLQDIPNSRLLLRRQPILPLLLLQLHIGQDALQIGHVVKVRHVHARPLRLAQPPDANPRRRLEHVLQHLAEEEAVLGIPHRHKLVLVKQRQLVLGPRIRRRTAATATVPRIRSPVVAAAAATRRSHATNATGTGNWRFRCSRIEGGGRRCDGHLLRESNLWRGDLIGNGADSVALRQRLSCLFHRFSH